MKMRARIAFSDDVYLSHLHNFHVKKGNLYGEDQKGYWVCNNKRKYHLDELSYYQLTQLAICQNLETKDKSFFDLYDELFEVVGNNLIMNILRPVDGYVNRTSWMNCYEFGEIVNIIDKTIKEKNGMIKRSIRNQKIVISNIDGKLIKRTIPVVSKTAAKAISKGLNYKTNTRFLR